MSEPVPGPSNSESWPPAPPTNPNPIPVYGHTAPAEHHPETPRQENVRTVYQQVYVEKDPSVLEGERLAKTSTIFGIISIYFFGVVFGPLAIIRASKAEKLGVDSTVGKVTGWIGTIVAILSILFTIIYVLFLAAIFSSAGSFDSEDMGTGKYSNSQEWGPTGGFGGDSPSFEDKMQGTGYENLPEEDRQALTDELAHIGTQVIQQKMA